jgi:hypothetical protein
LDFINSLIYDWNYLPGAKIILPLIGLVIVLGTILVIGLIVDMYNNAKNYLEAGTVESKNFEPGHTSLMMVGKMLMPRWVPDCYTIKITDGTKHYELQVPKEKYNQLNIGDYYEEKS